MLWLYLVHALGHWLLFFNLFKQSVTRLLKGCCAGRFSPTVTSRCASCRFFFLVFFWASGSVPCAWRWLVSTKVNYVMMCYVMMCYVLYCSTIELTLVIIVFVMIYCSTMERTLVIIVFVMIFVVQLNGHWSLLSLWWYIVVQLNFVIVMMYYSTIKPMLYSTMKPVTPHVWTYIEREMIYYSAAMLWYTIRCCLFFSMWWVL